MEVLNHHAKFGGNRTTQDEVLCFSLCFREKKSFLEDVKDFKTVARWHYDWRTNAQEKFQNMRKWVQSLCISFQPFRSEVKEKLYHSILDQPHV